MAKLQFTIGMALGAVVALCAWVASATDSRTDVRLDASGVSVPAGPISWGTPLRFVNNDTRPHEIYSNDCAELSSTALQPGESFEIVFAPGAKTCHFQDIFAPGSSAYSGTIEVADRRDGVNGAP